MKGTAGETGLKVLHTAAAQEAMGTGVSGEQNLKLVVYADGKHSWGPGGAGATDIDLFRFSGGTPATKGLQLAGGDLYISLAGNGILFKSPDGNTCKKLTIDNSGNAVWTTVTCP